MLEYDVILKGNLNFRTILQIGRILRRGVIKMPVKFHLYELCLLARNSS